MDDQTRNLNPTPEAKVAMIIWGEEYSKQGGGSMDFFVQLSNDKKKRGELVVKKLTQSK